MYNNNTALASLISSRICHDLANPMGAISNGLELMELSGSPRNPEFDLTASSVQNANAKLNFFRVAYGPAGDTELSQFEIGRTLSDVYLNARCQVSWQISAPISRQSAKLLFLLLQCLESGLPRGGEITVSRTADQFSLMATGTRTNCTGPNWDHLLGMQENPNLKASDVHFKLARLEAQVGNTALKVQATDETICITL